MRYLLIVALSCVFSALPLGAWADPISVGAQAGTRGLGLELSKPLSQNVDLRLDYSTLQFNRQINSNNQLYDVTANLILNTRFNLASAGALLDLHHGSSPLSWVVGLIANYNSVYAKTVPVGNSLVYNGVTYDAASAGNVQTYIFWSPLAPYVGIGLNRRWHEHQHSAIVGDVGVFYQRAAQVALVPHGVIAVDPAAAKYLLRLQGQLRDELAPYQLYPVLSVGVRFRL